MASSGQITAGELARVCAHYDLGDVVSARKLKRGSGSSPKVILDSTTGKYLLKRRAPGRDDPSTVAIAHQVQLFLAERGFPTARLVGTRRGNNSMLQLDGRVYELFSFVEGRAFNRTAADAEQAGRALARLHELLRGLTPTWQPTVGAYHAAVGVLQRLSSIPDVLAETHVRETTRALRRLYREAAAAADRYTSDWRGDQLIHADWHPGNMVFRTQEAVDAEGRPIGIAGEVLAVLDFDSVRLAPPVVDFANAALQFSILRGVRTSRSDNEYPGDEIDFTRFKAFCRGYHGYLRQPLRRGELEALPWLMVEALVTEAAVTIAATGSFGPLDGWEMLRLVLRKGGWIQEHAATMIDAAKRAV